MILGDELPEGFADPTLCLPGVLAVRGPAFTAAPDAAQALCAGLSVTQCAELPLVVLCDDAAFCGRTLNNFLWVTFTRSNPSHDIYGVDSSIQYKHWGCRGPLIIDARIKPHHAPPLIEDPEVTRRVDALAAAGGPLHGIL